MLLLQLVITTTVGAGSPILSTLGNKCHFMKCNQHVPGRKIAPPFECVWSGWHLQQLLQSWNWPLIRASPTKLQVWELIQNSVNFLYPIESWQIGHYIGCRVSEVKVSGTGRDMCLDGSDPLNTRLTDWLVSLHLLLHESKKTLRGY